MHKRELQIEILRVLKNLRKQNAIWFYIEPIFYLASLFFFFWRYQDEEVITRILIMIFPLIMTILSIYGDILTNKELNKLIISINEDEKHYFFEMLNGKEVKVLKDKVLIRETNWRLNIKRKNPVVKEYIDSTNNQVFVWMESI